MTSSIGCISTTHPRSPCLGPISLLSVGPTHSTRSPLRKGLSAMPTSSGSEPLVVSVACRRATYELERLLRERLDALGPAPRAELLHVLPFQTSSGPTGSASSGAIRKAALSPTS